MHIVCAPTASTDSGGVLPLITGFFGKTMTAASIVGQVPGASKELLRAHTSVQGFIAVSKVSGADALAKAQDANGTRWIVEADSQDHDYYVEGGSYVAWAPA
jgi:hypothetical protein